MFVEKLIETYNLSVRDVTIAHGLTIVRVSTAVIETARIVTCEVTISYVAIAGILPVVGVLAIGVSTIIEASCVIAIRVAITRTLVGRVLATVKTIFLPHECVWILRYFLANCRMLLRRFAEPDGSP